MTIQRERGTPAMYERQFEEALRKFKAARTMDPSFASTNIFLAQALTGLGRIDEAIESYKLGILRDDAGADGMGGLGNAYGLAGRREEALQELKRLTTLSTTRFVPLSELAKVYLGCVVVAKRVPQRGGKEGGRGKRKTLPKSFGKGSEVLNPVRSNAPALNTTPFCSSTTSTLWPGFSPVCLKVRRWVRAQGHRPPGLQMAPKAQHPTRDHDSSSRHGRRCPMRCEPAS